MPLAELNEQDIWRLEAMQQRYQNYCRSYGVHYIELELPSWVTTPRTCDLMDVLIGRTKLGDLAAGRICIEMMEEDRGLRFGSIIKSNIPRALTKCDLPEPLRERIRRRVADILRANFLPKEFRQYAWLARRLGMERWRQTLEKECELERPWVRWYVLYVLEDSPPPIWDLLREHELSKYRRVTG